MAALGRVSISVRQLLVLESSHSRLSVVVVEVGIGIVVNELTPD